MKIKSIFLFLCASQLAQAYNLLHHLESGFRDFSDEENLLTLGVGTALTFVALGIDQSLANQFKDRNPWGSASHLGNDVLGTGIPGLALGASTLLFGLIAKKDHEVDSGQAHIEALAISGLSTGILKGIMRRTRPDGGSATSFPSGHTSTTFTTAMVLHEMYDSLWIDALSFSLASYTGACRIVSNRHYLSDVIFGATLGVMVGHAFSKHHKAMAGAKQETSLLWMPYFENRENFGLSLSKLW